MTYRFIWIVILLLLISGLVFPPLMDNDAAEYASIALRMHRDQDYGNIINRDYDYLDKPHLLFWTAAAGYKLFGVNAVGYRLISVLVCLMGAYATYRLGRLLYSERTGKVAAVIFSTAQAIILSNHDVRTDSLLTGLVIIAIWNVVAYIKSKRLLWLISGSAALALAVGTKGMIAVLVTGIVIFFYLIFSGELKTFFRPELLAGLLVFFLVLSPFLICYYLQFDLHPEKFVNGRYQVSGIKFLLWDQSFERFAGDRNFKNNPDFFFFFHTFLWAFLPWTFFALPAFLNRMMRIRKRGVKELFRREQLTFLGCFTAFLIMSLSSFKLPHYINILFPLISISTAAYIISVCRSPVIFKRLMITQGIVAVLILLTGIFLNFWSFPVQNFWMIGICVVIASVFLLIWKPERKKDLAELLWVPSAMVIILVNLLLNSNFYPALNHYQAGSGLAEAVVKEGLLHSDVYIFSDRYKSFDFYSGTVHQRIDIEGIRNSSVNGKKIYVVVSHRDREMLQQKGVGLRDIIRTNDYRITRITGKFLNPSTRDSVCPKAYIVEVL